MKQKSLFSLIVAILVTAALLAGVSAGLSGIRQRNAERAHLEMLQTLLPGSTEFTLEPYAGEDDTIRSVHRGQTGFVIETVTYGYAGDITMFIGVSTEGKVTGLVVRDMHETFGLGLNALNDVDFLAQFLNTSGEAEVGTTVDAISGATVTSKAVTRSVNAAVAYVTGADVSSSATTWGG